MYEAPEMNKTEVRLKLYLRDSQIPGCVRVYPDVGFSKSFSGRVFMGKALEDRT